ncbi:MAG: serine hydrolase [Bacteroidales bacterium]|nr:serine hydrolase [Bacteroidales bacterium]MBN2755628.1 serine hydrolase [Bacteroidales bacterium]
MKVNLFKFIIGFLVLIEFSIIIYSIFFDVKKFEPDIKTGFFEQEDYAWVDSTIIKMSIEKKISQTIILEINNATIDIKDDLDTIISKNKISGLKYSNTDVGVQLILSNYCQAISEIPIFIGSEGSLINKPDFNFPIGLILNSIKDSVFIDNYLNHFAEILSLESVNIDFSNSIELADSKHFTFSVFSDKKERSDKISEKFRNLLHKKKIISSLNYSNQLFFNTDSIAVDTLAHINSNFPLDKYMAIHISDSFAEGITKKASIFNLKMFLQKYYNFKGLIISSLNDSINRENVKNLFNNGVDIFVIKSDFEKLKNIYIDLIDKGEITEKELDLKVKKILLAKSSLGLTKPKLQSAEISLTKIFDKNRKLISWNINQASVTLVKNEKNIVPLNDLLNKRTHLLIFGNSKLPVLNEYLNYYLDVSKSNLSVNKFNENNFRNYNTIIIAIDNISKEYFKDSIFVKKLKAINKSKNVILLNFSNPFIISDLDFIPTIIQLYNNNDITQKVTAQIIAGAIKPTGVLPLDIKINKSERKAFFSIKRLKYTIPEAAGFNSENLKVIDSIVNSAIFSNVMPGCQILAAKNGKVFYYKSFGYQTYSKNIKIENNTLFDLASITKVAATTLASMKLFELNSINFQDSIKYYIEDTINCTIKNHKLIEFYIHQTGLNSDMPILPYIAYTDSVTKRYDKYYSKIKDSIHTIKVADDYYFDKNYLDTIVQSLYMQEWDTTKKYVYSDMNFNIIYDIIKRKIDKPFENYLIKNFYNPMQIRTMGYLPLRKFNKNQIAPTQNDKFWRKQVLQGMPHDESAAIYGGIAGNAGLFSDANDLAVLFQMLLNGGDYGGRKILKQETIDFFTNTYENSHRGIGFNRKKGGLFGHSGFTGCVVWANPKTNFIFIFLSNSIHPKSTNKKLRKFKIREKVYQAILNSENYSLNKKLTRIIHK